MKKNILTLLLISCTVFLSAQTTVYFQINHKLGDNDFEFDTETENDLGDPFEVTRIEYYISDITIYHDEGLSTEVEDIWILSNGDATTNVELGDFDITMIDSVKFHVGVGEDVNHEDPSTYSQGHPLGFQNPSMHWGWAAGYRFVAMEGNAGAMLNDIFQIHALGDDNYHSQTHDLSLEAVNDEITISLNADYVQALSNISLDGGLIEHGFNNEAADLLENFRDLVFSPTSEQVGVSELENFELKLYPNPVNSGGVIFMDGNEVISSVVLQDLSGRIVQQWNNVNGQVQLEMHTPGTYVLSVSTQKGASIYRKVVLR